MTSGEAARQAVAALRARERTAPDDPSTKLALALALRAAGEPAAAEAKARAAVALQQGDARAHHVLGFMLHARGALDEGGAELLRARAIANGVRDPYHLAALTLLAHRDHARLQALAPTGETGQDFGERVVQAIAAWIAADRTLCRARLAQAAALAPAAPAAAPNRGAFETYRHYLAALLDVPPASALGNEPVIAAIGDSHGLTFAHRLIDLGEGPRRVVPALAFGCMAWHLASPQPSAQSAAFDAALSASGDGDTVLVCFGELDCRSTGGLFKRLRGDVTPDVDGEVERLVSGYVARLAAASHRGLRFVIVTPPASNADDAPLPPGERALFRRISPAFAARLREAACTAGWPVIDLAATTRHADGAARTACFVDSNHVRPDAFVAAARAAGFAAA